MALNMPSQRSRGRRAPMAEINVTPMVDVMLVLLVIFMVTAPLLVAGVKVQLPNAKAAALDQDTKPLDITIDKAGKVYIDKVEIPDAGLAASFAQARLQGDPAKGPQVYLRADRALDYGRVMAVMGELNHAGLNRVAMVTTGGAPEAAHAELGHDAH